VTVMNEGQRWWTARVSTVVLALLLGACGSRQSSAPPSSPPAPAASSPAPQASAAPPIAAAAVDFCDAIKAEFALIPQLVDVATEGDSERRRSLLAQARKANDKIVATAPADQKRDVEIVIGAANAANIALATNSTIPPAVMKRFDSPEYRAASARVRDYVQNECHINVAKQRGQRPSTDPAGAPDANK
jgi:hypothetical protein